MDNCLKCNGLVVWNSYYGIEQCLICSATYKRDVELNLVDTRREPTLDEVKRVPSNNTKVRRGKMPKGGER